MPTIRVQQLIRRDTGLPEDVSVNTFHFFKFDPIVEADFVQLEARFNSFWNAVNPGATAALCSFMAGVNQQGFGLRMYDLSQPEPRVPVRTYEGEWPTIGATSMPEEVASCLSFRAAAVSGENPARRRGRVYIGPLAENAKEVVGGRVRPTTDFINTLLAAGAALSNGNIDPIWVIRSDVGGVVTTPAVAEVYTDNTFDTQRRRGAHTSARSVLPAS